MAIFSAVENLSPPAYPLSLYSLTIVERVSIVLKLTKKYSPKGEKNVLLANQCGLKNESCLMYLKIYGLFL